MTRSICNQYRPSWPPTDSQTQAQVLCLLSLYKMQETRQDCSSRSLGISEAITQASPPSPRPPWSAVGMGRWKRGRRGRKKCQVYFNIRHCHTQGAADNFITFTYKNDCRVMQIAAEEALRQCLEADKLLSNLIRSLFKAYSSPPTRLALWSPVTQLYSYWRGGSCL